MQPTEENGKRVSKSWFQIPDPGEIVGRGTHRETPTEDDLPTLIRGFVNALLIHEPLFLPSPAPPPSVRHYRQISKNYSLLARA